MCTTGWRPDRFYAMRLGVPCRMADPVACMMPDAVHARSMCIRGPNSDALAALPQAEAYGTATCCLTIAYISPTPGNQRSSLQQTACSRLDLLQPHDHTFCRERNLAMALRFFSRTRCCLASLLRCSSSC